MIDRELARISLDANAPLAGEPAAVPGRAWVITFADLAALLLSFFVMLFAMTGISSSLWESAVESLTLSLKWTPQQQTRVPNADRNTDLGDEPFSRDLVYLGTVLEAAISRQPLLAGVVLSAGAGSLTMSVPARLIFVDGGLEMGPAAGATLAALSEPLRNIANPVIVKAAAPRGTAAGTIFATDWEVSLARASAMAGGLKAAGYGRPVAAYGTVLPQAVIGGNDGGGEDAVAPAARIDIVVLPGIGVRP